MARKKVIWLVERFYECVRLTLMVWWILIKNFLVYGLIDTSCLLTSYMMRPENERDSIKIFIKEKNVNLKNSKIVSFAISMLFIAWICMYIILLKNNRIFLVVRFTFSVLTIWMILIGVYISMLGLTWATTNYSSSIEYYAQAFANIFRQPIISLTSLTFWLIIYLIGIRNLIVLFFILPGLLIMVKTGIYKKLQERKQKDK